MRNSSRGSFLTLVIDSGHVTFQSPPPTSRMMPPVIATRDFRSLSAPPQVVHFMPIQATPSPATDTMMPTIIKARVAWSEPAETEEGGVTQI